MPPNKNSHKRKRSEETESQREERLKKARDYRKNISEETETEIQIRIEKMKAYCAVKKLTQKKTLKEKLT